MAEILHMDPTVFEVKDINGKIKFTSNGRYLKRTLTAVGVRHNAMDLLAYPVNNVRWWDRKTISYMGLGAVITRYPIYGSLSSFRIYAPPYGGGGWVQIGGASYINQWAPGPIDGIISTKSMQVYEITVKKKDGSTWNYGRLSITEELRGDMFFYGAICKAVYGMGIGRIRLEQGEYINFRGMNAMPSNNGDAMYGTGGNLINSALLKWAPVFYYSDPQEFGWQFDEL